MLALTCGSGAEGALLKNAIVTLADRMLAMPGHTAGGPPFTVMSADVGSVQESLALAENVMHQAILEVRQRLAKERGVKREHAPAHASLSVHEVTHGVAGSASNGGHAFGSHSATPHREGSGAGSGAALLSATAVQPGDVDVTSLPSYEDIVHLASTDPFFRADLLQIIVDVSRPSFGTVEARALAIRLHEALVARDRRAFLTCMRLDETCAAFKLIEHAIIAFYLIDALSCHAYTSLVNVLLTKAHVNVGSSASSTFGASSMQQQGAVPGSASPPTPEAPSTARTSNVRHTAQADAAVLDAGASSTALANPDASTARAAVEAAARSFPSLVFLADFIEATVPQALQQMLAISTHALVQWAELAGDSPSLASPPASLRTPGAPAPSART
ncbi:MAG: hypothetical protein EOO41_03435, partial [Methanobacteriota archaeon]